MKINTNMLDQTEFLATSDKYKVITTREITDRFEAQGFSISSYQEGRYRLAEKQDKVRHVVRMKYDTNNGVDREVVIMNSYDSSSSLRINFGAFRAVCTNQLVFGDSLLEEMKIKHTMLDPFSKIDEYSHSIKDILEQEATIRRTMENTRFSAYDMERFAREAMAIREPDLDGILDFNDLSTIQRPEDLGKNLWIQFNRVQENLVKGSYRKLGTMTNPETGEPFEKYKKAKELKSPSELLRVNKQLHNLALSYL